MAVMLHTHRWCTMERRFVSIPLLALVILAMALGQPYLSSSGAQDAPQCPPGFRWDRMSGVGCMQENCLSISGAKYGYTGNCLCVDEFKGCYEPVDYSGFDRALCGPNCPFSALTRCISHDEPCAEGPSVPGDRDLVRDLERFLNGDETAAAPTPAQAAAGGATAASLIGAWVLINLLSGADPATVLRAVREWRSGTRVGTSMEPDTESSTEVAREPGAERSPDASSSRGEPPPAELTTRAPDSEPPEPTGPVDTPPGEEMPAPPAPGPAAEGVEQQVRRHADDVEDYANALDQSRAELRNLRDRLEEHFGDSDAWRELIKPLSERVLESTDPGVVNQLTQRLQRLLDLRAEVDRRLPDLPPDQLEAVTWTYRGLRLGGELVGDVHRRLVTDPAQSGVKAVLPEDAARRINELLDTHQAQIESLLEGASRLVVNATENACSASQRHQMRDYHWQEDFAGVYDRERVEYPDFGRGWRRAEGWYRDARQFLGRYIWQLRQAPPSVGDE